MSRESEPPYTSNLEKYLPSKKQILVILIFISMIGFNAANLIFNIFERTPLADILYRLSGVDEAISEKLIIAYDETDAILALRSDDGCFENVWRLIERNTRKKITG